MSASDPSPELPGTLRDEARGILDHLLSDLPGVVYRCRNDEDWTMLGLTSNVEGLTGWTVEDLTEGGRISWRELTHAEDRHYVEEAIEEALTAGDPFQVVYRIQTRSGEERWILEQGSAVDEDGKTVLAGYVQDVTGPWAHHLFDAQAEISEVQRSKALLEETMRLLEHTFSSLDEAVLVIDTSGNRRGIVQVNQAAERIFGYSHEELLGETTAKLHVDRASFERFAAEGDPQLRAEGVFRSSFPLKRKDGSVFEAEQTVTLLDPEAGLPGGAVSVVRDVSRQEELERQLRQAQKMEAVGRLAAGIAHDFNNLLTIIRGQSDLVMMDLTTGSPLHDELGAIRDAADRAAQLTNQLLAFGREQVLRPRAIDLNEIVESLRRLLERTLGEDVEIRTATPPDILPIRVDPGQLEQVIMNLALNARDAMPEGGTLTLETSVEPVTESEARTFGEHESGSIVQLEVSDTGIGMDERTRSQVFEPFFTTKNSSGGTGLGLSMSYGIVKQSGGTITLESAPGKGTTFTIRFPATEEAPEPPRLETPGKPPTPARLSGVILVVEDDPSVLRVARKILNRAGLDVRTAGDTVGARELLAESGGEIDVLLTDLVLPGASGRDLVDRARSEFPAMGVVVMSGYAEGSPGKREDLPAEVAFIQKPFSPEGLLEVIGEKLAER